MEQFFYSFFCVEAGDFIKFEDLLDDISKVCIDFFRGEDK